MASGQKPRVSLPPELSAIDEAWGTDEQPTLPRPSRAPTAPVPGETPEIHLKAPPPTGIELEEFDDDLQERATTVPKIPLDEYAREMMSRDAQQAVTEAPPPGSADLELDLDFTGGSQSFDLDEQITAVTHPSQLPTAPPPAEESCDLLGQDIPTVPRSVGLRSHNERTRTLPEGASLNEMEFDLASELPPPVSPASSPIASAPLSAEAEQQAMKDKFAMGDFSGALELAENFLHKSPSDVEARSLAEKCREVLLDMYSSRISGLDRVPRIVMSPDQIRWLSLDHRAGFLLSMVDGVSSVDDLLDVSGMHRLDALRILCSLLDQKVIQLS